MTEDKLRLVAELIHKIPNLTPGQVYWVDKVVRVFECRHKYKIVKSNLLDKITLNNFGDAMRIHHSFSAEPFSKDKFEYVLGKVLGLSGHTALLAPKGNRGHDITIDGVRVSLKTQADRDIRADKIWISKFMELGKGKWADDPDDLVGLRKMFLDHLDKYERILVLRALIRGPDWHYELVEIPKRLFKRAKTGKLEMRLESRQLPKPGYCYVYTQTGKEAYQLYFDGGSERKLQVKSLQKSLCVVHADWKFTIPLE